MGRAENDPLLNGDDLDDVGEELRFRTADVHNMLGGVSVPWLMKVFGMGRQTVERKLTGLRPVGLGSHGSPLYLVPDAAARLVKPTLAAEELLKDMKPSDMPEKLREAYWNSKLKQQRFEERAGTLWRTEKVMTLVGEFLQEFRQKAMMLPDDAEKDLGLTREQHKKLQALVDEMQGDLYEWVLALKEGRATPNQLGEEADEPEEDFI